MGLGSASVHLHWKPRYQGVPARQNFAIRFGWVAAPCRSLRISRKIDRKEGRRFRGEAGRPSRHYCGSNISHPFPAPPPLRRPPRRTFPIFPSSSAPYAQSRFHLRPPAPVSLSHAVSSAKLRPLRSPLRFARRRTIVLPSWTESKRAGRRPVRRLSARHDDGG